MKTIRFLLYCATLFVGTLLLGSLSGCGSQEPEGYITQQGRTMGTTYRLTYLQPQGDSLRPAVDSLLNGFLMSVSTYEPKSTISAFNQSSRGVRMDSTFRRVYEASRKVYQATEGAFDPTVGPLVNAWGFGYKEKPQIDSALVDSLRRLVGMDRLRIKGDSLIKPLPSMELDFGAIAKGYGVDLVAQLLKERGCVHYFVEIGGEIRTAGVNPDGSEWRVGIERPQENARALKAVLQLSDQGMATSGNYRNFYYEDGKRYAHTIDPKTGYPVDHQLLSATVVADECMTADAYATAFMVMGREAGQRLLKERPDLQAYFIYGDEQGGLATYATPQLKRKVETIPEQGKEAS